MSQEPDRTIEGSSSKLSLAFNDPSAAGAVSRKAPQTVSSRRLALGTLVAAAASVAAIPATTSAGVALTVAGDAELLQLGEHLRRVSRAIDAIDALAENNPDITDEDWEPILSEQAEIVPKILSHTATTREGLAVQVAACIAGCAEIWVEHEFSVGGGALDTERPFIEAVARYTGVEHPTVEQAPPMAKKESTPAYDPTPAMTRHRQAIYDQMACSRVKCSARGDDPKFGEYERAENRAFRLAEDAAKDLAAIQPTTIIGAITLLAYVDAFHVGAVKLPADPKNWYSCSDYLPTIETHDLVREFDGKPEELPFNFHVIRNARLSMQRYYYPDTLPASIESDDPIYAAIAATKQAAQSESDAYDQKSKAENDFLATYGNLTPDGTTQKLREEWATVVPELGKARLRTHADITRLRGKFPADAIGLLHRQLNLQTVEHQKVEALEAAVDRAGHLYVKAIETLIATKPTTHEGIVAMLDYLRADAAGALQLISDNGLVDSLLSTIASAITRTPEVAAS
jgi:hypothetical protein